MIVHALFFMGFSCNRSSNSHIWYIGSIASNHMTGTLNNFLSSTPYFGPLRICTVDRTERLQIF